MSFYLICQTFLTMRSILIFLVLVISRVSNAQSRYSFGTDYAALLTYPQKHLKSEEPVIQYGLAGTRELSLASNVVIASYYYQTNVDVSDSLNYRNKYIEVPISLKAHYTIFDKVFKGHMMAGTGFNMLLAERITLKDSTNEASTFKGDSFKPNAFNFFWGIGFDVRINKYFYFSADGLLKGFYFFSTPVNKAGGKFAITPMTKAGIFVWLNKRE
jgi:hypothetical protein